MTESNPAALARMAEAPADRPRRFAWNPGLVIGLVMLAVVAVTAVVAPLMFGTQATGVGTDPGQGTSAAHPLGTDTLGRDMLARTLVATQSTVLMALFATALSSIVGIAFGIGVWLAPRRIRELGLRLIEFAVSYPTMLVAIIVAAILGQGVVQVVVAVAVANIAGFARLTANLAAKISSSEYVTTARLMGVPVHRLALRHVLPNMAEPILILIAGAFSGALVEISGLSFIGLGAQTPAFDWGTLLNDGLSRIAVNPIVIVGPAVALTFTSLAALMVGDGLAAAANPRSNSTRARLVRAEGEPAAVLDEADDTVLVADGITVLHGSTGRPLVSDVSFTIRRGEVVGIVGESGSGKSLTASVVARLLGEGLEASARRLELGGTDLLGRVSGRTLASKIGLVYQDPGTALNPALVLGTQLSDVLTMRLGFSRRGRPRPARASVRGGEAERSGGSTAAASAPALGRHEAARDDRIGDEHQARSADRRRADDRARRDRAARGALAAQAHERAVGHGGAVHLARPRRRSRPLQSCARNEGRRASSSASMTSPHSRRTPWNIRIPSSSSRPRRP